MLALAFMAFAHAADFDVTVAVATPSGRVILPDVHRVVSTQPVVVPLIYRGEPVAGLLTSDGSEVCLAFFDAQGARVSDFGGPVCTRPAASTGIGKIATAAAVVTETVVARP